MPPRRDWIVSLIDDDDDVRDSLREVLQCDAFKVEGFASGHSFLQTFDPAKGLCIILDLHMPEISGFQVLDALQARGNTVPVILFSGRSDFTTEEFAPHSGVIAVLAKPLDADGLIDLIQSLLEKNESAPA